MRKILASVKPKSTNANFYLNYSACTLAFLYTKNVGEKNAIKCYTRWMMFKILLSRILTYYGMRLIDILMECKKYNWFNGTIRFTKLFIWNKKLPPVITYWLSMWRQAPQAKENIHSVQSLHLSPRNFSLS